MDYKISSKLAHALHIGLTAKWREAHIEELSVEMEEQARILEIIK